MSLPKEYEDRVWYKHNKSMSFEEWRKENNREKAILATVASLLVIFMYATVALGGLLYGYHKTVSNMNDQLFATASALCKDYGKFVSISQDKSFGRNIIRVTCMNKEFILSLNG